MFINDNDTDTWKYEEIFNSYISKRWRDKRNNGEEVCSFDEF